MAPSGRAIPSAAVAAQVVRAVLRPTVRPATRTAGAAATVPAQQGPPDRFRRSGEETHSAATHSAATHSVLHPAVEKSGAVRVIRVVREIRVVRNRETDRIRSGDESFTHARNQVIRPDHGEGLRTYEAT